MPCHFPATSVSCRRRAIYQMRPPSIAAKLDLSKPGEAWAEDYLRRASTGNDAFWCPLGIRRDAAVLFVAVRWLIGKKGERFSVVTISLTENPLRQAAARRALLAALRRRASEHGRPGAGRSRQDVLGNGAVAPVLSRRIQRPFLSGGRAAAEPETEPHGQLARGADDGAVYGRCPGPG